MRIIILILFSLSVFSCKKSTTDNGHGRMCAYTCGNATLKPQLTGSAKEDTILLNTYRLNSGFVADSLEDSKYYYKTSAQDLRLLEGKEYQVIIATDTFRITGIQFEPPRQACILCADHCTVAATSVTVNGIVKTPSSSARHVWTFPIY